VTKLYDVKPVSVRTNITRGKFRRRGIHVSLTSKKKKAVVTLPEGAKIPGLFEE
jgi:ribosomal protein L23